MGKIVFVTDSSGLTWTRVEAESGHEVWETEKIDGSELALSVIYEERPWWRRLRDRARRWLGLDVRPRVETDGVYEDEKKFYAILKDFRKEKP